MSALTRRFSRLRRFHRLYRGEHGSASSFAVIVVAVLMLVAGLCIEGGRILNARATMAKHLKQAGERRNATQPTRLSRSGCGRPTPRSGRSSTLPKS